MTALIAPPYPTPPPQGPRPNPLPGPKEPTFQCMDHFQRVAYREGQRLAGRPLKPTDWLEANYPAELAAFMAGYEAGC